MSIIIRMRDGAVLVLEGAEIKNTTNAGPAIAAIYMVAATTTTTTGAEIIGQRSRRHIHRRPCRNKHGASADTAAAYRGSVIGAITATAAANG